MVSLCYLNMSCYWCYTLTPLVQHNYFISYITHPHHCRPCQPRGGTVGESEPESSPAQVNSGKLPPWMLRSVSNRWAVPDTILQLNSKATHRHRHPSVTQASIRDRQTHACVRARRERAYCTCGAVAEPEFWSWVFPIQIRNIKKLIILITRSIKVLQLHSIFRNILRSCN